MSFLVLRAAALRYFSNLMDEGTQPCEGYQYRVDYDKEGCVDDCEGCVSYNHPHFVNTSECFLVVKETYEDNRGENNYQVKWWRKQDQDTKLLVKLVARHRCDEAIVV